MSSEYWVGTVLPVLAFAAATSLFFAYLSYRMHLTDRFLWFKQRPIAKTRDYDVIYALIMERVKAQGGEPFLTPEALARIAGAAEKAVPQLRIHGSIELRLPALYEKGGQIHDVIVTVRLKKARSGRK